MTKFISDVKRVFLSLLTLSLLIGMVFLISCDDGGEDEDPQPELYDLSGIYTFKKATFVSGKEAVAQEIGLPAALIPTDITDEMAGGLLAEAPCKDLENGAVELKSDKKLFFTCIGETNEDQAGTWDINSDRTNLDLNLSIQAGALQIKLQELTIDETNDVIGGSIINFPLTPDLVAGFFPEPDGVNLTQEMIDAIIANLPAAIPIDVDIEFQKITQ